VSYALEWTPGAAVVGLVALLCVPSLVLIGLVVVLLAALAALVALAGAIVATPDLLLRSLRRRRRGWSAAGQHQPLHRALNAYTEPT
jgi:hypothetical protein